MSNTEKTKVSFKDAPVGARFHWPKDRTDRIWVKVHSYQSEGGLIVQYNGSVVDSLDNRQQYCQWTNPDERAKEGGATFDTIIEIW